MKSAGLDIGSTTSKLVVLEDGRPLLSRLVATGAEPQRHIDEFLAACGRGAPVVVTGYGRHLAMEQPRVRVVSEITALATGAAHLFTPARVAAGTAFGEAAQPLTLLDVGGQDTKVILLSEAGQVQDFLMNDRCAAGSGRFVELIGRVLETPLAGLDAAALSTSEETRISSMCAVYAESEVVGLLAAGVSAAAIARGVMRALAARLAADLKRLASRGPVLASGGGALFQSLLRFIEEELGRKVLSAPEPQLVAALGAALLAGKE